MSWFHHLHQSPYCYRTYPGTFTAEGREACPCGWIGQKLDRPVRTLGFSLGDIGALREGKPLTRRQR